MSARDFPMPARAQLITYAATTRTVTADGLLPLLDAHDNEVAARVIREAMRLIDAHPHPGDNPVSFYCGLLESLLPDAEREEATASAATATPTGPTGRVAQLLDAIRTTRGRWTTTRAAQFYRDNRIEPPGAQWSRTRTVARGDLRDLAAWGHLLRQEEPGRQYYTLTTRKDRTT